MTRRERVRKVKRRIARADILRRSLFSVRDDKPHDVASELVVVPSESPVIASESPVIARSFSSEAISAERTLS